jgi:hypothetical protein
LRHTLRVLGAPDERTASMSLIARNVAATIHLGRRTMRRHERQKPA